MPIFPGLWAVFTVIAAAAQTVRTATQRELTQKLGTVGATHVRFLFGLPFALVFLVAAPFNTVGHGTWTSEFTSKENCEAAALALKQMVSTGPSGQGFVQFTCVKK